MTSRVDDLIAFCGDRLAEEQNPNNPAVRALASIILAYQQRELDGLSHEVFHEHATGVLVALRILAAAMYGRRHDFKTEWMG
jgi:hypothetical protein